MQRYLAAGAKRVTIDPGRDIVLARCKRERPAAMIAVATRWYEQLDAAHAASHGPAGRAGGSGRAPTAMRW